MSSILVVKNSLRERLESLVEECVRGGIPFKDAMQQVEMEYVMQVLAQTGYNVSKAATVLGINRNTLSRKIEEFQEFEVFRHHRQIHTAR